MKALIKYQSGPGNVALRDVEEPKCAADQVLLEISDCGICGTDLHVYHDTFKNYPPVILGHEFSGTVVERGRDVTEIPLGGTYSVLGATAITCGHCTYCERGDFMFCSVRRGMGHGVHGAFTRWAAVRPDQLYPVPPGVSLEVAALAEPLAVAVHVVEEVAHFKLGDTVLLSGPGPIGLLCLKMLLAHGLQVIVAGLETDQMRLETAKKYGAECVVAVDREDLAAVIADKTKGQGVALAVECSGAEASARNCLEALQPMGHYVQVGHFGKDLLLPWDLVAFRQLRIHGSLGYTQQTWRRTMKVLAQPQLRWQEVISHQLPLAEWERGFALMESKQAIKILLKP